MYFKQIRLSPGTFQQSECLILHPGKLSLLMVERSQDVGLSEFNYANFSVQKLIASSTFNNMLWFLIKSNYKYQFSVPYKNHCGPNKDGASSVASVIFVFMCHSSPKSSLKKKSRFQ